jgi:hypothetical protein
MVRWDGGVQPRMPARRSSEEELYAARLAVCKRAEGHEDARMLLDMLGLLPESSAAVVTDDD